MLMRYLVAPTILAFIADAIWIALRLRLKRRIRRIMEGSEENRGLLHPGMAMVVLFTFTGASLCELVGNSFATGRMGYSTNTLLALSMVFLAIVFTILSRAEYGIPQPDSASEPESADGDARA